MSEAEDKNLPSKLDPGGLPESPTSKALGKTFARGPWGSAVQFIIMWGKLLVPEAIRHSWLAWVSLCLLISLMIVWKIREQRDRMAAAWYTDTFAAISDDSLAARGWALQFPNSNWWLKRGGQEGGLTLFTLQSDDKPSLTPRITNLMVRAIPVSCFATEVRLINFMPRENGQQAGILLMEDTTADSRYLRFSIAYKDSSGAASEPGDIYLQAALSGASPILQQSLFHLRPDMDGAVLDKLHFTGLRIEKRGQSFRFLFDNSSTNKIAFREFFTKELDIHPRYIGLFAEKESSDFPSDLPVRFRYFSTQPLPCE